uniref:Uncharacterized protein n=1 Tax=Timspurckia oligopyrenoides TaxID=708627 RepID=A0A7S0ZH01_9RHOD|mmetsp:Transcript_4890/g.8512  ORF Transcript_4890/g.8512 Transcript_4890/m.8512 type:complete len:587 (+) Transcript_4890:33-1793(+)
MDWELPNVDLDRDELESLGLAELLDVELPHETKQLLERALKLLQQSQHVAAENDLLREVVAEIHSEVEASKSFSEILAGSTRNAQSIDSSQQYLAEDQTASVYEPYVEHMQRLLLWEQRLTNIFARESIEVPGSASDSLAFPRPSSDSPQGWSKWIEQLIQRLEKWPRSSRTNTKLLDKACNTEVTRAVLSDFGAQVELVNDLSEAKDDDQTEIHRLREENAFLRNEIELLKSTGQKTLSPSSSAHKTPESSITKSRIELELEETKSKLKESIDARNVLLEKVLILEQSVQNSQKFEEPNSGVGESETQSIDPSGRKHSLSSHPVVVGLEKQLSAVHKELALAQTENERLLSRCESSETRHAQLEELIVGFRTKVALAETGIAQHAELVSQIEELRESRALSQRLLHEASERAKKREMDLDILREQQRISAGREDDLRMKVQEQTALVSKLDEERIQLKEYLVRYETELNKNERKVRELGAIFEEKEAQLLRAKSVVAERDTLLAELRTLQQRYRKAEESIQAHEQLAAKIDSLQATIAALRQQSGSNARSGRNQLRLKSTDVQHESEQGKSVSENENRKLASALS